jgi:ABC-2 type transport system permease protein
MKRALHLAANPVIVKELRSRMRGVRAFAILTGVLLLLGVLSFGLYRLVLATSGYGGMPLSPQIGQALFAGLVVIELLMICFVTPALTAGAISGEREMQTYEMLLATPLEPASILRGKLVSALSYIFLLIFAAVPMSSLVYTFGGVSLRDMIKALAVLLVVAVTLGVLGIFMSTWLRRSGRATVLTYLLVLALLVGPYLVYIFVGVLWQSTPPEWILVPNPLSALFSALTSVAPNSRSLASSGVLGSLGLVLAGRMDAVSGLSAGSGWPRPVYHYTLVLYGGMSAVLYLLATRLVRPVRRWRMARREVLAIAAAGLVFVAAVVVGFVATADRYERRPGASNVRPTPAPAMVVPAAPVVAKRVVVAGEVSVEGPLDSPVATPTPNVPPLTDDEIAIYTATVRQLVTVDHTFGNQPPDIPAVYIVRWTDDSVGAPDATQGDPRLLSPQSEAVIAGALSDLGADVVWVDDRHQVPLEDTGEVVKDGGAIVTLGNIYQQDDGSVQVSASIFFAGTAAAGKTYVLQQIDGEWRIVGTTGAEWIS